MGPSVGALHHSPMSGRRRGRLTFLWVISPCSPRATGRPPVLRVPSTRSRWIVISSGSGITVGVSRVRSSSVESWWPLGAATVPRGMHCPSSWSDWLPICPGTWDHGPRLLRLIRDVRGVAAGEVASEAPVVARPSTSAAHPGALRVREPLARPVQPLHEMQIDDPAGTGGARVRAVEDHTQFDLAPRPR